MKILIVAATELEVISKRTRDFPVLITGVGMVNTAIQLTKSLIDSKYELILNIGIAGSFSEDILIGDVVEVVEDNFSEVGYEEQYKFSKFSDFQIKTSYKVEGKTNLKKVKGITVNKVHGRLDTINEIKNRIDVDIETMEGASIFQLSKEFNIPCMQIRAISNIVGIRDKDAWDIPLAIENLNNELEKILDKL
tara:strand:- start:78 stop:656 length:579 start_codon:yes stop_codon:yes gene_type:complete